MPIDRAQILANGWNQGSFFLPEDAKRLLDEHGERVRTRIAQPIPSLILASHACDVLSHLDEDEPDVTVYPVLELRAGEQFSPTAGQRPRVWHFEKQVDGQSARRALNARSGFSIPRGKLEALRPWHAASLLPR